MVPADNTTLMGESREERKSFLTRVKKWSEKAGLKLNIQKTKIKSSITSRQIDGQTMETVTDLIFLDSRSTADGDCAVLCLVTQLCPTLFNSMDCGSLPNNERIYSFSCSFCIKVQYVLHTLLRLVLQVLNF